MATKVDALAAKQAKQKKILVVLGIVLLAVVALQGPRLLKQVGGSSSSPAPAVSAADQEQAAAASAAAAAATPGAPAASTAAAPVAASVSLASARTSANPRRPAEEGQLRAFSLFTPKDPFVQSLPDETSGATSPTGEPTLSDTQPGAAGKKAAAAAKASSGPATSAAKAGQSQTAPTEGPPEYATISVNGTPEQLALDDMFPAQEDVFVLLSLKPKSAEIGIAGGKLTKGESLTLKMGKPVTLVNTATGARYALKLVYTGSSPEQMKEFSPGATSDK
jgi:hypothetical protein